MRPSSMSKGHWLHKTFAALFPKGRPSRPLLGFEVAASARSSQLRMVPRGVAARVWSSSENAGNTKPAGLPSVLIVGATGKRLVIPYS
jgi:hypothetical protein